MKTNALEKLEMAIAKYWDSDEIDVDQANRVSELAYVLIDEHKNIVGELKDVQLNIANKIRELSAREEELVLLKKTAKEEINRILESSSDYEQPLIGSVIVNGEGMYGTLEYSTFGYFAHFLDERDNSLCTTLGTTIEEIQKNWIPSELPSGYVLHEHGGVKKEC